MKKSILSFCLVVFSLTLFAQMPAGGGGRNSANMNAGRFYGKVIDASNKKPVEYASVQLTMSKFDSVLKKRKDTLIAGMLTDKKGEFSLENLPVFGKFKMKITAIGFKTLDLQPSFDIKFSRGQDMSSMLNSVDKDLGNLSITTDIKQLQDVTVTATKKSLELSIDRKVFNVDKNIVTAGGTAEDVLKNVPSLAVDIDGNVKLRNSAPQIFVDGRPTTLTIDQIPADAIESVEIISNPSAKFDASGGMSGIVNIVLKKNRKTGYNGSVRAGIDSRARVNLGGDINARQGKVNVSLSANFNQRKTISNGYTDRYETFRIPVIRTQQNTDNEGKGYFGFIRAGIDYFIDNRNTLSLGSSFNRGNFTNDNEINYQYDSLYSSIKTEYQHRNTHNVNDMKNIGNTTLSYKHLFTKAGRELTADFTYSRGRRDFTNNYVTSLPAYQPPYNSVLQLNEGYGTNTNYTFQSDFVNPIADKKKIEMGIRANIREVRNQNLNYIYDKTSSLYVSLPNLNSNYKYSDKVFAAYTTFTNTNKKGNFGYQLGLRVESSFYDGSLIDSNRTFSNKYPFSLFPSAYLSYKLKKNQELQLNYARKINRPNFFQLLPFIDYSDSLNISVGNPGLIPEFTNSLELSYQKEFKNKGNLLITAYFKNTDDLITRYIYSDSDNIVPKRKILVSTFVNANRTYSYGLEIISRNPFTKWWEVTANANLYNAHIEAGNLQQNLQQEQLTMFAKLNQTFKLPKNFTIQLTADYQTKSVIPQSSGGGGGGGRGGGMGGGFGGGLQSATQGYIKPQGGVDFAVRKEFGKDKQATLSLNINDIFKTRKYATYSSSSLFTQDDWRIRDWRVVRLTFSYRFGKFDVQLFKRKNTKVSNDNGDMMQ